MLSKVKKYVDCDPDAMPSIYVRVYILEPPVWTFWCSSCNRFQLWRRPDEAILPLSIVVHHYAVPAYPCPDTLIQNR